MLKLVMIAMIQWTNLVAFGQAVDSDSNEAKSGYYIRLCEFWSRDFNSNGYVCDYLGSYTKIIEEYEYKAKIKELEDRIRYLEEKIK